MSKASTPIEDRIADFDPEDPEALAALEDEFMAEEEEPSTDADPEGANKAPEEGREVDAKQDEKAAEAKGEPSAAQEQEKVVQARDGKHTIPYSVLEREREQRARAEATVKALNRQLEELKQGNDADVNAAQISQEDLEDLEDLSPELAKVIRHQMSLIEKLSGEVVQLRAVQEGAQQAKAQSEEDLVMAAIAENEELSAWQEAAFREENPDQTMWNRAAEVDLMLRKDPYWADRSYAERFAKVVETVRGLYGEKEVARKSRDNAPSEQEQAALKAAADARLKEKGGSMPTSLSDIPGGAAPAQSDVETLENVSSIALGQKFMEMSSEQIEAYLARLG